MEFEDADESCSGGGESLGWVGSGGGQIIQHISSSTHLSLLFNHLYCMRNIIENKNE